MKKQYKNPFEDPDAEFYGKKVKDYKIPKRRKEEPKPMEPLEKKVEQDPLMLEYEEEIEYHRRKKKRIGKMGTWGFGSAFALTSISYLLFSKGDILSSICRGFAFGCCLIGFVGATFAIQSYKDIKNLEKKVKELKK